MLLAAAMLVTAVTKTATAKSLYVIADIKGSSSDATQPVQAYDVGLDGALAFQAQHDIPHRSLGAVGMAIDSDSGYLFITYEASGNIQLVDGTTMTDAGRVRAPDAQDLAGIVFDHHKELLYCADRGTDKLYAYNWEPKATSLTHVEGSPFILRGAKAFGIALDEIDGFLYVANANNTVNVYDTSNWELIDTIELSRLAISVAVDVMNGFMYTGGGFAGNNYLTQYHLATGTEAEVQVEPDAGVMGLGVDPDTGLIYMSTGRNNEPGGDNLLVYDTELNEISRIHIGGNPAGLAIPGKDIGFNPLNLDKTLRRGAMDDVGPGEMPSVGAGREITYGISFENKNNDFTVTDVTIVDALPREVIFVTADDDGVNGRYDEKTHTYTWSYADLPPGSSTLLELTVRVRRSTDTDTIISNSVTINSNETAPSTMRLDVLAKSNSLNLTKSIVGAVGNETAKVDPNEIVTYDICFDNLDNDFTVTDIFLVDTLPPEVSFVSGDDGKGSGNYDLKTHTYSWWYPNMKPGSSACVGLVVHVDPNLLPGTVITNSVIIDSNEAPPSTASVDAVTAFNSLNISKSIVGADDGKLKLVDEADIIEYVICFDNNNNDLAVTNVSVVDTLPEQVSLVRSDGGHYDSKTHTVTWSFDSLEPGSKAKLPMCVDLVVEVNKGVPPATLISNSVTITSNETEPATATADASTFFNPLNLNKIVLSGFGDEIEWVDINDSFLYGICFENNNDFPVTNVSIIDKLPKEVSFVSASDEGVFGQYDPNKHTFEWLYPSIEAGSSVCLGLEVHVNPDIVPFTTITNSVTIDSDETVPTPKGTTVDVITAESPIPVESLTIIPDIIRSTGAMDEIQAVVILPEGIGRDEIKDAPLLLKPGYVKAKRHAIFGTDTRVKVIAAFDRAEVVDGVDQYGQVTLKVVGKFKTGRSFFGEAVVYMTRFTGD